MLFRSISLPSISGHFRFGSIRFNALPPQLISLLGFAPAIRRCSLPTRFISSLSFSSAALFSSQLICSAAIPHYSIPSLFLCLTSQFPCTARRFNAAAILCNSVPLQFGTERFSSVAIPCASIPLLRIAFLFNSIAFQISASPQPFTSGLNCSPAVQFRTTLFRCFSYPVRAMLFPCSSNRFNGIHFLWLSPLCVSFPSRLFSGLRHFFAYLFVTFPMHRYSPLCPCSACHCFFFAAHFHSLLNYALTYSHVKAPLPEFLHWPMPLSAP